MSKETDYRRLRSLVGHYLGYGPGPDDGGTAWTDRQQRDIDECVRGGLRRVYENGYDWSWKKPIVELRLLQGTDTVDAPDDYGGREGDAVVTTDDGRVGLCVPFVSISAVDKMHAGASTSTGSPQCVAEGMRWGVGASQRQRFYLRVWPKADQDYIIRISMYLAPEALTSAFPYAYGGRELEAVREAACKAYAEIHFDGISNGPIEQEFQRLLKAAVDQDHRHKAKDFGYNHDRSAAPYGIDSMWPPRRGWRTRLTINGVTYP